VLTEHAPLAAIFAQGLIDAGWDIGYDLAIIRRTGEATGDRWGAAARELRAQAVDVILAGDHEAARAARATADVTPIVAVDVEHDPILSGFARTLARPGGTLTGLFCDFGDAMSQLMRALREALPTLRPLVALTDGETTQVQLHALREAAVAVGFDVDTLAWVTGQADGLVDRVAASRAGLLVLSSPGLAADAARLAKRAARRKVPSAGAFIRYAQAGGLLARGPSLPDAFRRAAAMVDRVLRGARAADIPIERPPRFELVLNAKAAATLEVMLPANLVSNADYVLR
jgi:putative tryptophan/tyrosine transport system substrate-binding protein